jgi:hypothetical protein
MIMPARRNFSEGGYLAALLLLNVCCVTHSCTFRSSGGHSGSVIIFMEISLRNILAHMINPKFFLLLFLFPLFICNQKANAQTDEIVIRQVFRALIDSKELWEKDILFFERRVGKTYFNYDSISFQKLTGLQVPQKILVDIVHNTKNYTNKTEWDENEFNKKVTFVSGKDTIAIDSKPYISFLPEKQVDSFLTYASTKIVYSISKIAFDDSHQTAVFEFSVHFGKSGFSSEGILIHKVFGRWLIVRKYHFVIS